jgi:hypothetical protein
LAVAQDSPAFAGAYIDRERGGVPVFLVTDPQAELVSVIEELVPDEVPVEVNVVERSLAELTAMKREISSSVDDLLEAGVDVTETAVSVRGNAVLVGILDMTEDARQTLLDRWPDAQPFDGIRPVSDACTIESCPSGMKGGLMIHRVSASNFCTSGYLARRTDGEHNNIVLVTAGHCVAGFDDRWYHDGTRIGSADPIHGWHPGSLGDIATIDLNTASVPSNRNRLLVHPTSDQVVQVTSVMYWYEQVEGLDVCRMGEGSFNLQQAGSSYYRGRKCGEILIFDSDAQGTTNPNDQSCRVVSGTETCKLIYDMKVVDFDSTGGDSGGAVFLETESSDTTATLMGTHVHSQNDDDDTDRGWYSGVYKGIAELMSRGVDLTPCLTSSC